MKTQANNEPVSSQQMRPGKVTAETVINQAAEKMGLVALGVVVVMVFFTTTDVFLRYFFNAPISEVYELTGFMMLICGCLTLAWCSVTGKHVSVDVLVQYFNPRLQEVLNILNYLMVMGVCLLMVVQTYNFGLYMIESGAHPTLIKLPYYPFYFLMTLGFCSMFFAVLPLLIRSVYKAVKG